MADAAFLFILYIELTTFLITFYAHMVQIS